MAPLQIIPTKTEVSVTTDARDSCSIEVSWTMPVQPAAGPRDELRLWTAVTWQLLGGGVSPSGSRRNDIGYVLHVGGLYDCNDPKHLDEDSIRDRLAQLALRAYSNQEVEDVRTSYAHVDPEEPEAAREAQAITAADITRVMARFQPPSEVLVVRVVH